MKVYVVTSGEYSDYHIEAVFTNKKKAETYYYVHNEEYGYYSIEEYDTDEYSYITPLEFYEYLIRVDLKTRLLSIRNTKMTNTKRENYGRLNYSETQNIDLWTENPVGEPISYECRIYLKEIDDKKAKKIAADMCAKALAEANNL